MPIFVTKLFAEQMAQQAQENVLQTGHGLAQIDCEQSYEKWKSLENSLNRS